jgi:hypothetical protein
VSGYFDPAYFDPAYFDTGSAAALPVASGLLMDPHRAMRAIPYNGPVAGSRLISARAIRMASAKFRRRNTEDEELLLLGLHGGD